MDSSNAGAIAGAGLIVVVLYLAVIVLMIAAMWKVFKKAHQPGWAAIVPLYNMYVMSQIAGRPDWFVILFFIPFVNIVAALILTFDMAKVFGKSPVFAFFGLLLFAPIGYMMLGFGKSTYVGPLQAGPVVPPMPAAPTAPPAV